MIFFINLVFSILFWITFEQYYNKVSLSKGGFYLISCFFFLFWIIICGGQYFVGTDYAAYLKLFNGEGLKYYNFKGEILFTSIISIANYFQIKGQALFYIFYSINFIFLFLILKRVKFKYAYIFVLLYITYSNLFNNQLNILRQTTAIYIGTYACILYLEGKKIRYIVGIIASILIHTSSLIFFIIPFLIKKNQFNSSFYKNILIVSFIGSMVIDKNLLDFSISYLPLTYAMYIKNGAIETVGISLLLTKYIFIPLFWLSIQLIEKNKLKGVNLKLYNIGFLGFCLKLFLLKLTIIGRISDNLLLFTIFPLYFCLVELASKKKTAFIIIIYLLVVFYALKTLLFPKAEYLYKSIYLI